LDWWHIVENPAISQPVNRQAEWLPKETKLLAVKVGDSVMALKISQNRSTSGPRKNTDH